jgi:hypothetical protein
VERHRAVRRAVDELAHERVCGRAHFGSVPCAMIFPSDTKYM